MAGVLKGKDLERAWARYLRARGWTVHVAEAARYIDQRGRPRTQKEDLFGLFDVLAIGANKGTWAVQCTTAGGASRRRKRIDDAGPIFPPGWRVSVVTCGRDAAGLHWRIWDRTGPGTWDTLAPISFTGADLRL